MKAIKVVSAGKAEIQDVERPELKDEHLLIQVKNVALNPTDWMHIDYLAYPGATVGCDFMGYVEEVGPNCTGEWKKGDRVAGVVHGCDCFDLESGAFAEYLCAVEGVVVKVPDRVSDEEAATIGVAFVTVGMGLYQTMGLPWPGSLPAESWLLVYGGSSATGSVAIQFAKLSGARVITTCSPRNFDFVKSLGAEDAFDYNDPECAAKIREHTNDKLHSVFHCVGGETSARIACDSISSRGGQICSIVFGDNYPREDVRVTVISGYKLFGKPWRVSKDMPATMEDYEFAKVWMRLAVKLWADGAVKAHPQRVGEGLESVFQGLDDTRAGRVSGTKLVYRI